MTPSLVRALMPGGGMGSPDAGTSYGGLMQALSGTAPLASPTVNPAILRQLAGDPGAPSPILVGDKVGAPDVGRLTEGQSKDVNFWARATDANRLLNEGDLDRNLASFFESNAEKLPFGLGNYLVDDNYQRARQAADQLLMAILRKDTGAAITNQEFDMYGPMLLPQPGDHDATIAQKRRAREVAIMSLKSGLGTATDLADYLQKQLGTMQIPPLGDGAPGDQDIPEGAVELLRSNPRLAPAFEQKYGKGAAQKVLGGGMPAAQPMGENAARMADADQPDQYPVMGPREQREMSAAQMQHFQSLPVEDQKALVRDFMENGSGTMGEYYAKQFGVR